MIGPMYSFLYNFKSESHLNDSLTSDKVPLQKKKRLPQNQSKLLNHTT